MQDLVPEAYARAVREHDLEPVDRPSMELLPGEDGAPPRFKAVVDVRPQIDLGAYKGLKLEREPVRVDDADVERAIESLAREKATLVPAEREARLGDIVTVDFEGRIDGVPFEGGAAQGQQTELREDRFIPGFVSGITGMKAGEQRTVEARFPDDYTQAELAGKDAEFSVTLHEVKELELPALDDAFAQAVSNNETMKALRADVRKRLEAVAESRAKRDLGNQAIERLSQAHDFPLPQALVDREVESMLDDAGRMAARAGVPFEEYLSAGGTSADALKLEYRPQAEARVKATMLLEAVAKAENITATPAEINAEIESLARQYGQPADRVRQALGRNLLSIADGIVRNKTVEFLLDEAEVSTKESNSGSGAVVVE